MRLKVKIDSPLAPEYRYTWALFARDAGLDYQFVPDGEDLLISESPEAAPPFRLSRRFRELFEKGERAFLHYFDKGPLHQTADGHPDYLSSCFYLLSCMQEYGNPPLDKYDRFGSKSSLQHHFNCLEEDLVQQYFRRLYEALPGSLPAWPEEKSSVFLSHDIDLMNNAWKEDGKFALSTGRLIQFGALMYRQFFGKPHWHNIEKLLEVDGEFKMKATFFWLPVKGEETAYLPPNADYTISSKQVKRQVLAVSKAGQSNGLHKSVSQQSFQEELAALQHIAAGSEISANRYHFLKFRLPAGFDAIEAAGLQLDCSLGFPETPGFRNSYGKAYQPYNLKERRPYRFVEAPLHFMDTSFRHYLGTGPEDMRRRFQAFMRAHQSNTHVSLLWHNNYYSNLAYRKYRRVYPELLFYLQKHGYQSMSPADLIEAGKLDYTH